MKKYLTYIVAILFCSCQHQSNKKLDAIKTVPSFKILSVDSATCINSESIPKGSPVIFMYFDPECGHCQRETENMMRHITELRHAKIYLITNYESSKGIQQFRAYYHLDTAPNFYVGRDYEYSFFRAYASPEVPYMAIYDGRRQLKRIYKGETDVQFIINAVQD